MREIRNSASTTYDWLKNILNRSLELLTEASASWTLNREAALTLLSETKTEKYRDYSEEDWQQYRIDRNDNLGTVFLLIQQLLGAVEQNPFPGEQMSLLVFASRALPNVRFRWEGKGAYAKGKGAWRLIFCENEFFCTCGRGWIGDFRVCFPAVVGAIGLEEIERKLCELCREDGTVPAGVVPEVVGSGVNTVQYRSVKKVLQDRGWTWGQRRLGGKMEKVVFAPDG
jgi:hypothetical protein